MQSLPVGFALPVLRLLDQIEGQRQLALGIGIILLVFLLNWRAGPLIFVGSLSGPIYQVTQAVIQRPRPSADLVHVIRHTGSYSFPSGHMAFFTWTCVLLVVCLLVGRAPRAVVNAAWVAAALIIVTSGIARIYLGEHWPSDVIGGLALGLGWTCPARSVSWLSDPVLKRGTTRTRESTSAGDVTTQSLHRA